jgi:catecholate siderophore receptor
VRVNAVETASQSVGTVGAGGFVPLPSTATTTPVSNLPLSQLFVRLQSHDRVIHDKSLFNQTEFSTRIEGDSIQHNLLIGAELGHDTYRNQAYFRDGSCNGVSLNGGTSGYVSCEPLLNPTYTASPSSAVQGMGNLAASSANTVGVYVNDTAEIGPQLKLVGGLRYDNDQASIANSMPTATTLASESQTVHFTSVRLGPVWQPSETQSYYASYSTSFDPSLEQLTITTGATQPLPPEKNKAYELGGKWDPLGGRVSLNAAIFQITQFNARSVDSNGNYTATGTVRVNGVRMGASGLLARGWKIFAGYSLLEAKIIEGIAAGTQGMVPLNTPKNAGAVWTTYEVAPHWEIGGGATYQSSRFVNNTDLVQVGSYARWDGTIAYRQRDYDIRLNLFNLTNKYYYDALIQSDGGRSAPGTGRSAMLSFSYHI